MSRVIYERHEPIDVEMIQNTEDEVSIDLSTVHPLDFLPLVLRCDVVPLLYFPLYLLV